LKLPDLFGNTAAVRVLEVLASKPGLPWTRALLAHSCDMDPRTLQRVFARLRTLGVLRFDSDFGVVSLDLENPLVVAFLRFHDAVAAYEAAKRAADG